MKKLEKRGKNFSDLSNFLLLLQSENEQKSTTSGERKHSKVIQNGKLSLFEIRKSFPFLHLKNITKLP